MHNLQSSIIKHASEFCRVEIQLITNILAHQLANLYIYVYSADSPLS